MSGLQNYGRSGAMMLRLKVEEIDIDASACRRYKVRLPQFLFWLKVKVRTSPQHRRRPCSDHVTKRASKLASGNWERSSCKLKAFLLVSAEIAARIWRLLKSL